MISVPALPFSDAKHCNHPRKRLQPLPQTFAAQMYPLGAFPDMAGLSRAYGILCPMVFAWMAGVLPYDYLLCQQILVSLEGQYVCSCGELGHAEVYDAAQGAFF